MFCNLSFFVPPSSEAMQWPAAVMTEWMNHPPLSGWCHIRLDAHTAITVISAPWSGTWSEHSILSSHLLPTHWSNISAKRWILRVGHCLSNMRIHVLTGSLEALYDAKEIFRIWIVSIKGSQFPRQSVISITGRIIVHSGPRDYTAVKEQLVCSCAGCILLLFCCFFFSTYFFFLITYAVIIMMQMDEVWVVIITLSLPDSSAGFYLNSPGNLPCRCVCVCVRVHTLTWRGFPVLRCFWRLLSFRFISDISWGITYSTFSKSYDILKTIFALPLSHVVNVDLTAVFCS